MDYIRLHSVPIVIGAPTLPGRKASSVCKARNGCRVPPLCWCVIVGKPLFAAALMKAAVIGRCQDLSLLAFAGTNSHPEKNEEDRLIVRPGVDQCRQKDMP